MSDIDADTLPDAVDEDAAETDLTFGRYLPFTLNGEAYALDILHVTEILECRHITTVPMMPDFVRGVINLRGRAVPVIDLAARFARGTTTVTRRTSIVIVHVSEVAYDDLGQTHSGNGQDVGIMVDTVNKVADFTEDDIEPPPAFGTGIHADFISGMARREDDFVIVLNIDRVLSVAEMAGLASAKAGTDTMTHRRG